MSRPALVSVVVPMRDERSFLLHQLDAIAAQDYDGPWELVVSDDGSRDGSPELAARWMRERGIGRLVTAVGARGPGAARNAGAREAEGDLLAFCDADDVVTPGWLSALVAAAGATDLVAGSQDGARLNPAHVSECHHMLTSAEPHLAYLPVASGSNLAIWRSVLEAVGGFPEDSPTGEDVALSWTAQNSGYRLAAAPGALVHKRLAESPRQLAAQFFAYGRGDAWLFRRFRAQGMPGRTRDEMLGVLRHLLFSARGLRRAGRGARWSWIQIAALTAGRAVGSVRYRVLFT